MNPAFSAKARAGIIKDHGHYASMDLLQNGTVIQAGISLDEENGAEVKVDGSQAVRRTFSATLANPTSFLPISPGGVLSPFLSEVQVWSGIIYPDGSSERWSVFVGGIEDPKIVDADDDLVLTIEASDRAQSISDRRLSLPYVITSGTPVVTAIQNLITSVRPNITFSVSPPVANPTLPLTVIDQLEDPWQHAQDLAGAYGLECFFNSSGVCVIQPVPDPSTQPIAWVFAEGANAIITSVDALLTAKGSYSHAIVTGQSVSGAPVRSDQYDTNPASYTYYLGPFGDRPVALTSDLITTQAQADAAAVALLNRQKGASQNVGFNHVPLTALDEHDVVYIVRNRIGLNNGFVLDSFTIPLYPGGTMNPSCRSQQL